MAARDERTPAEVRRDIETEREQLANAVDDLRAGLGEVTDVSGKLPIIAAGALGAGFFLAGGVGATMRLLARRSREGKTMARLGSLSIVGRG